MEYLAATVVIVTVLVWASFQYFVTMKRRKLPPGPYAAPILGPIPHQSLANLSQTYGSVMSLKVGSQYLVVVSSPQGAKAVLQEYDQVFSSRTMVSAATEYHKNSVSFLPVGSRWRKTRKLCREHLFSTRRMDESQGLRRQKLTKLRECSVAARAVNIGDAIFITLLNLITFTLFSTDFVSFDADHVTQDLRETVNGAVDFADFFPFYKPSHDPQGVKRQSELNMSKLLQKFEVIINQRLEEKSRGSSTNRYDLLESLVNLMEDTDYTLSINDIKHLFLDMFLGGSHTTPSAVEMAMTELLFNPKKMAKVKSELTNVIGKNKQLEESDISRLPYLQAVIKETLRLHPPSPFLFPRKVDNDVEINGYTIPKNTQIFVNIWAIGRDSSTWPNPDSFEPERFLTSKIDYKGHDFALVPFGSGRRICLGLPLVDRIVPLTVASLIHEFDWKLEPGVKQEDGIATHNAVPLMAVPIKV